MSSNRNLFEDVGKARNFGVAALSRTKSQPVLRAECRLSYERNGKAFSGQRFLTGFAVRKFDGTKTLCGMAVSSSFLLTLYKKKAEITSSPSTPSI